LLAVSIGADSTYANLVDKKATQKIAENINYRHRMAQYAGRASVNLYTHIFFKGRVRDEEGYILFIRQNAVQVLIPHYGLEGTLFLDRKSDAIAAVTATTVSWTFDEEEPSLIGGGVKLTLFHKLVVQVSLDSTDVQHEKLALRLVSPVIRNFSVPPAPPEDPATAAAAAEAVKRPSRSERDCHSQKKVKLS
jgi:exosome complex exonuclease DIS3/RRP44